MSDTPKDKTTGWREAMKAKIPSPPRPVPAVLPDVTWTRPSPPPVGVPEITNPGMAFHRHLEWIERMCREPKLCEECYQNYADYPSRLCPGCEAYLEHQR